MQGLTTGQIEIICILAAALVAFVSERVRYDLVALGTLVVAVLVGVVPSNEAFSGFANDAVITVAAVLIMSRALALSGAIDVLSGVLARYASSPLALMGGLCLLGGALSAFMNNVGALALLMPVALTGARRGGFAPGRILMPLSFATMLGGMCTLVGTPANLLVSQMREQLGGQRFSMFDFAPVGLALSVSGIAFIVLIGWRLLARARPGQKPVEELFDVGHYVTEVQITEKSSLVGKSVETVEGEAKATLYVLGLLYGDRRFRADSGYVLRAGDVLLVQSETQTLQDLIKADAVRIVAHEEDADSAAAESAGDDKEDKARERKIVRRRVETMEAVVRPTSWVQGTTASAIRLRARFDVNLLAISRRGRPIFERPRDVQFEAGDVLLLEGRARDLPDTVAALGCLPLADRRLTFEPRRVLMPFGVFALAVGLVVGGVVSAAVGFTLGALLMVVLRMLPLRQLYDSIDWPVVVLLGALIPVGHALETTGTAHLLADGIVAVAGDLSGHTLLGLVLVATMAITPLLNNAATVLIMGPIANGIALRTGIDGTAFLMAVAIGASCDFLTPFGHQNNTLIMGPGGYRFGDFWRMGLPLDVIVVAVSVAFLPVVFPF